MFSPSRIYGTICGSLALVAVLTLPACNADPSTLQGVVRYAGKPLTSGSVILYCQDREIVRGIISEDGTYTISHVPRGNAMVVVQTHPRVPEGLRLTQKLPPTSTDGPMSPSEGSYSKDRRVVIPRRYSTPEESGLSVQIKPGTQVFDIELK